MSNVPYLGATPEGHRNCFNKVTTKLYCQKLSIPTLDFIFVNDMQSESVERVLKFFNQHGGVFVKSSRQGSSVGCAMAKTTDEVQAALEIAFQNDSTVLVEPLVTARELELSAFEYSGKLHITIPGEVTPPDNDFYSFDEKYSSNSSSQTSVKADISQTKVEEIQSYARKIFQSLELKDHCRIDFFFDQNQNVFLNEVNTFPGLTPISMFPKMMENYGVRFSDYLSEKIN